MNHTLEQCLRRPALLLICCLVALVAASPAPAAPANGHSDAPPAGAATFATDAVTVGPKAAAKPTPIGQESRRTGTLTVQIAIIVAAMVLVALWPFRPGRRHVERHLRDDEAPARRDTPDPVI
jgi:hypothetical protein